MIRGLSLVFAVLHIVSAAPPAQKGAKKAGNKACTTLDGPGKGKPCVFPFFFLKTNKTYTECTIEEGNEYWCSTGVDKNGQHMSGTWGRCSEGCPGVPEGASRVVRTSCKSKKGHNCFFPMSIDGFSYRGCIADDERSEPYCFAKDKDDEGITQKDECTAECPRDYLITNKKQTLNQVLNQLMEKPRTSTTIEFKGDCKSLVEDQWKSIDKASLPEPAKAAKTYKDAFKAVCNKSKYCAKSKSPLCQGDFEIVTRKNVIEDPGKDVEKADCSFTCGHEKKN